MGAVASGFSRDSVGKKGCWLLTKEQEEFVKWRIIDPVLTRLKEEGTPFVGVLYVGLMVDPEDDSVRILEFNVRFGDPEAQVSILFRLVYGGGAACGGGGLAVVGDVLADIGGGLVIKVSV